jgi:hypothetical protein
LKKQRRVEYFKADITESGDCSHAQILFWPCFDYRTFDRWMWAIKESSDSDGSVMILGQIDEQFIEWIGPACAVMALTVVYGYFVKALCRMAILAQEGE